MRMLKIATAGALAALAVVVVSTGVLMAQDGGAAPSNLVGELGDDRVLLRWTPGMNEAYIGQLILHWEDGNKEKTKVGGFFSDTTRDDGYVPRANFPDGGTFSFQIAGAVKVEQNGQETIEESGHSNIVTLVIPAESSETDDPGGEGEEGRSAEPKPTNLEATTSNGQVTLTWTPGNDDTYTAQEVKRRVVKGKGWTTIRIDASASQYVDSDVEVGTKYVYRVKGVWDNGKGRLSKPARVTVR